MGTNYDAIIEACPACGRGREVHIGKSSGGWTFTFHSIDAGAAEDLKINPIRSYKEWLALLERPDVTIRDEYYQECSLEDFKAIVEGKKNAELNHAIYEKKDGYDGGSFLDSEGHSFSPGEFS